MTITKSASARYEGLGKDGKGYIWAQSGALDAQPYGFNTRFEDKHGTNPEELIGAAHSACFTMALSFALAKAGYSDGRLETKATVSLDEEGEGFTITRSHLDLTASVPGVDEEEFDRIANETKVGCPVSKLLNCEITLKYELTHKS